MGELTDSVYGCDLCDVLHSEHGLDLEHDHSALVGGLDVVGQALLVHDRRERSTGTPEPVERVRELGVGRELGTGDNELGLLLHMGEKESKAIDQRPTRESRDSNRSSACLQHCQSLMRTNGVEIQRGQSVMSHEGVCGDGRRRRWKGALTGDHDAVG